MAKRVVQNPRPKGRKATPAARAAVPKVGRSAAAAASRGAGASEYEMLVRGVKDYAIFMLDADGRVASWTSGAERIKGYAAHEVIGKPTSIFFTPEDVAGGAPRQALETAARDGRHLVEGWRVRKDGTKFWAEVLTAALREPDGTLRGYAKVIQDATGRMQVRDSLAQAAQESDAQVRAILEAAVDAIITIDSRGRVASFNQAAQRMFGYTPEEVIGRNVMMLMPDPYRREHDGYMANYLRTGRAKIIGIGREVVAQRKDGSVFPIDLAVSEVKRGPGRESMFTGIIRDITDRKRMEKEILEISEREQRRIGHDLHDGLCQQLTGIAFLVQALQQKLNAEGRPETEQVTLISTLLGEAVNQARTMSHGLYPVDPQPDGLMVALRELAASVRSIFRIDCVFRCPKSVMIGDNSTATHLYRIAQESVQNAIRHGKASRIVIRLLSERDALALNVVDNGVGFPPDGPSGNGIGLRTMAHRAHVIGASLSFKRRAQGGSEVTCRLRLRK